MIAYVRIVADLLGLHEWDITVSPQPADDGNLADISISYGQHRGVVRFAADHKRWSPQDTRDTVVHELLHCHLNLLTDLVADMFSSITGSKTSDVAAAAHQYLCERVVDALAHAVAPYIPLPDGTL